jgi:hypothetical protein
MIDHTVLSISLISGMILLIQQILRESERASRAGVLVAQIPGMRKTTSRSSIRWWVAVSVMALVASIDPSAAQRPRARMDKEVQAAVNNGGTAKVRVIVRVEPRNRKALRDSFGRRANHKVRRELGGMSALAMELPQNAIDGMSRTPGVLSVSIDAPIAGQQAVMPITGELLQHHHADRHLFHLPREPLNHPNVTDARHPAHTLERVQRNHHP